MTRTRLPSFLLAAMSLLVLAPQAYAGMPTVRLSDIASLRIQTISFFLLLTLVSAWGTKGLWNGLVRDFPGWPKLTYRGALFGTVLWGLLFLVVLTMISGARELMTPGAWEKDGLTYQLAADHEAAQQHPPDQSTVTNEERRQSLDTLRSALWLHAATHESEFPESPETAQFAEEFWQQPGDLGIQYRYLPNRRVGRNHDVLAFENAVYGDDTQWVLYADGSIKAEPIGTIEELTATTADHSGAH